MFDIQIYIYILKTQFTINKILYYKHNAFQYIYKYILGYKHRIYIQLIHVYIYMMNQ
jgi:hypothetical protein